MQRAAGNVPACSRVDLSSRCKWTGCQVCCRLPGASALCSYRCLASVQNWQHDISPFMSKDRLAVFLLPLSVGINGKCHMKAAMDPLCPFAVLPLRGRTSGAGGLGRAACTCASRVLFLRLGCYRCLPHLPATCCCMLCCCTVSCQPHESAGPEGMPMPSQRHRWWPIE